MKVLVVEDSLVVRTYVCRMLERQPGIELVPAAFDGLQAIDHAVEHRPDLILMDIQLPRLDGVEAIHEIMDLYPCPIVVLSGHLHDGDRDRTFDAFHAGAVDVVPKPEGLGREELSAFHDELTRTIRLMSQVKVVRRRRGRQSTTKSEGASAAGRAVPVDPIHERIAVVAIGASLGGPTVLFNLLNSVPAPLSVPVLISQHIAVGFASGLCSWLARSGHHTIMARDGYRPRAGDVVIAPGSCDLLVEPELVLRVQPCESSSVSPNIDRMFMSLAESIGATACGILLTGMGSDGARGLRQLAESRALTIAQQPGTCVADSMPSSAIALNASERVLTPEEISAYLCSLSVQQPVDWL